MTSNEIVLCSIPVNMKSAASSAMRKKVVFIAEYKATSCMGCVAESVSHLRLLT